MRFPAHSSDHSIWRSCPRELTHGEYFLSEVQTWSLCERLRWRYRSCHFILHAINLLNPWRHSHRYDNIKSSELLNCLLLLTWSNDVYSNNGRMTVRDEGERMWKEGFLAHDNITPFTWRYWFKATENASQNSRSSKTNSNFSSTEHKMVIVTLLLQGVKLLHTPRWNPGPRELVVMFSDRNVSNPQRYAQSKQSFSDMRYIYNRSRNALLLRIPPTYIPLGPSLRYLSPIGIFTTNLLQI